ncbi:MAG: lipopolysaccharide kinase InaA family protein [Prevotella sp.]|jgi:hypothetical protein
MKQTIILNSKYENLRSFVENLPDHFEQDGDYIYGGRRNLIKKFTAPGGLEVNVKRYHPPHGPNLLVYSAGLRRPKGWRAYHYAQRLLAQDVSTPEPIAYIEQRNMGLLGQSYFVSIQSPLSHTFYEFGDAQPGTYEDIAETFGAFTAHLHEQQILHLDYSPGNILWDRDAQGNFHFTLVDINRMRFGKVSAADGASSLRRLWGPKHFFVLIAESYARHRHWPVEPFVKKALQERERFWTRDIRKHGEHFHFEP